MFRRKSDGRWCEILREVGGRRLKSPKYFYGKTQAELKQKINEFTISAIAGPLFRDLADQWHTAHAPTVRYKTAEGYIAPLRQLNEYFGKRRVTEITPPDITAFIRKVERKGYSRRTVQLRLNLLQMIFDFAVAEVGCIDTNPCRAVTLSKNLPVTKRELPSDYDIAAIIAHANDDRFSLLPFLLYCTGLRLGEALALTDKDFGPEGISITKKVSWQPNKPVLELWTKTEKGIRVVPILDILRVSLPAWTGYLFSDDGKAPYSNTMFRRRWAKYAERTGVSCIRHVLRHEFATLLFEAEVDVKEAAEIMGHDEKVMRDVYTHITESRRQSTASRLNAYVNTMYDTAQSVANT